MLDFPEAPLRAIGLHPVLRDRAEACFRVLTDDDPPVGASEPAAWRLQHVVEVRRDRCLVHDGLSARPAVLLPALLRDLQDEDDALAVGDWVWTLGDPDHVCRIQARVQPLNHLVRRDADGRRHAVVSNVDLAWLVMGLDDDFNPRRLERYLALVLGCGLPAAIVLTKADVAAERPGAVESAVEGLRRRLPDAPPIVAVDGTSPRAADLLAPWLAPGRTVVLLGSSGAGKSTLTNTLAGQRLQDTGAVRQHDSRGKHTTTARTLFRLPGGACLIDTPGLRALRPDLHEARLGASFGDIGALARHCRFRNCRHGGEPGCAVRAGVDADRLRNHEKLLREARRDTLNALERRQQLAQWKARGREGEARGRHKRGEW